MVCVKPSLELLCACLQGRDKSPILASLPSPQFPVISWREGNKPNYGWPVHGLGPLSLPILLADTWVLQDLPGMGRSSAETSAGSEGRLQGKGQREGIYATN